MVVDIQYFCRISNYHCRKFEPDRQASPYKLISLMKRTKTASSTYLFYKKKIIEVETVKSLMISLLKQQVAMEKQGYDNLLT